jgi:N-acetyltransferase
MFIEPITLTGNHGSLEPLNVTHLAALQSAANDGELWKLWYTSVPEPGKMADNIAFRLAQREKGVMMPFVVRRLADDKIVGCTTFANINAEHRRVEIGYTWYAKSAQRTPINTEIKLMMLAYAFEEKKCIAVEFYTHWFNHQSRAAIERLGAKLDGVLRNHRIGRHGEMRDTCVYTIICSEWPAVKSHLQHRLLGAKKEIRT